MFTTAHYYSCKNFTECQRPWNWDRWNPILIKLDLAYFNFGTNSALSKEVNFSLLTRQKSMTVNQTHFFFIDYFSWSNLRFHSLDFLSICLIASLRCYWFQFSKFCFLKLHYLILLSNSLPHCWYPFLKHFFYMLCHFHYDHSFIHILNFLPLNSIGSYLLFHCD